jgi:hypothetical protein
MNNAVGMNSGIESWAGVWGLEMGLSSGKSSYTTELTSIMSSAGLSCSAADEEEIYSEEDVVCREEPAEEAEEDEGVRARVVSSFAVAWLLRWPG